MDKKTKDKMLLVAEESSIKFIGAFKTSLRKYFEIDHVKDLESAKDNLSNNKLAYSLIISDINFPNQKNLLEIAILYKMLHDGEIYFFSSTPDFDSDKVRTLLNTSKRFQFYDDLTEVIDEQELTQGF